MCEQPGAVDRLTLRLQGCCKNYRWSHSGVAVCQEVQQFLLPLNVIRTPLATQLPFISTKPHSSPRTQPVLLQRAAASTVLSWTRQQPDFLLGLWPAVQLLVSFSLTVLLPATIAAWPFVFVALFLLFHEQDDNLWEQNYSRVENIPCSSVQLTIRFTCVLLRIFHNSPLWSNRDCDDFLCAQVTSSAGHKNPRGGLQRER